MPEDDSVDVAGAGRNFEREVVPAELEDCFATRLNLKTEECSLVVLCSMKSVDEDMPHGLDTTIYLVQDMATAPGSSSSKQRNQTACKREEKLVEKVYADSRRLRECSKYFETCMDDSWARSKPAPSQLEFRLELQADVAYYRDCFSRMEPGSFFQPKPIPSVDHCLELLKVASQIVFQEVVDLGIKYLSATPWSADDEVKIRRFYESGHISLDSEAHAHLIARLRMSLTEKTDSEFLSLCLEHAWATPEPKDRRVFEETFQIIVSGPNRHVVIESVKKEATRLLCSFETLKDNIQRFAWLHGLLRSVHADQSIVDLLLKERYIIDSIYEWLSPVTRRVFEETFQIIVSGPNRHAMIESVQKEAARFLVSFKEYKYNVNFTGFARLYGLLRSVHADQSTVDLLILLLMDSDIKESPSLTLDYRGIIYYMEWVKLIGGMLQDVLDGRLFLTSSELYTLFINWRQMCVERNGFDDRDLRKLFTTFLMTFPFQEQTRMMESWDGMGKFEVLVDEVYEKWRMGLVNVLASRRGQEVTAADSREPSDSEE